MIVMWGSNARNAHPIFFHHVLKAVNNGAKLFVVDPRRSETAQFADRWLGLHVGSDIALSNTIAREIIHAGLAHEDFISPRHEQLRGVRGVGRGLDARARRAGDRRAGRDDPRARPHVRHAPRPPSCAGRSASPSTTTASTTCSRSAIWRCSPARSAATAPASARCAGRTTCRAAATWARSRTSCPDSRTSSTRSPARSSRRCGAPRSRPSRDGT